MTQQLQTIIHGGGGDAEKTIIWMHGLGADMHDFEPILPYLQLKSSTRVIFPQAPNRPITVNNGYVMPGWYDITDFTLRDSDINGIKQSAAALEAIYRSEIERGIRAENILFAGFSQGGVMAIWLGTRLPCAGILALSCYLVNGDSTPAGSPELSIMQMHGRHDPIVPFALGQDAHKLLQAKGYVPQWREYDMGHEVCPAQIADIGVWLRAQEL